MIETLLLHVFAGAALAGGLAMLVARHPMRVAVALIATMLALAGIYAMLGVHVIAVFQVLIYVGAVMVFMVYVIMLIDPLDRSFRRHFSRWLVPGIAGGVLLVAALAVGFWRDLPPAAGAAGAGRFGLQSFAAAFLAEYWLHFELISVFLVAAVVAAIAVFKSGEAKDG